MYAPQGAFFSELFGTSVRYSGASLGAQLSAAVAGGFSPLIATALLPTYGPNAIALYIIVHGPHYHRRGHGRPSRRCATISTTVLSSMRPGMDLGGLLASWL